MGLRRIIYLRLSLSQRVFDRLFLTKRCRCFSIETKGADGAADLLEALSQSTQLEELDFTGCSQIPAGAWQKIRSAKWLYLKTANFRLCLAERNGWRFSCFLRVFICVCWKLHEFRSIVRIVKLSYELELICMGLRWIVYLQGSQPQRVFDRLFLTKHCRCFNEETQGADGAADLLQALSQSTQLEELDFHDCSQIPLAAWATTSGWRLAEAAEGTWHPRQGAAASSWPWGTGRPGRRGSMQTWSKWRERRRGSAMIRKIITAVTRLFNRFDVTWTWFVHCFRCFPLLVQVDIDILLPP